MHCCIAVGDRAFHKGCHQCQFTNQFTNVNSHPSIITHKSWSCHVNFYHRSKIYWIFFKKGWGQTSFKDQNLIKSPSKFCPSQSRNWQVGGFASYKYGDSRTTLWCLIYTALYWKELQFDLLHSPRFAICVLSILFPCRTSHRQYSFSPNHRQLSSLHELWYWTENLYNMLLVS